MDTKQWWKTLYDLRLGPEWDYDVDYTAADVRFLDHVLRPCKRHEILDLGCGTGRHTIGLAKLAYRVVGVDYSQRIVEHARKQIPAKMRGKATFRQGDMRRLSYREQFGAVFIMDVSFGLFSHRENCGVIKGISQALRKGGRLVLELFNPHNLASMEGNAWWRRGSKIVLYEKRLDMRDNVMSFKGSMIDLANGKMSVHPPQQIRVYSFSEIGAMLRRRGLHIREVFGGKDLDGKGRCSFSASSFFMIIVAEK